MQKVFFHYADRKLHILNKKKIQSFVEKLFSLENKGLHRIDYIFCSDDFLLGINRTHLQHDFYTDIITFELSENKFTESEIYISLDRVKENARDNDQTFTMETLRVIFHGALHLCGYKDKTPKDEQLMRKMENKYLALFSK